MKFRRVVRSSKCKCACSIGILGMVLCTVLLGFSMGGLAAATLSNNVDDIGVMYDSNNYLMDAMKFFDSSFGMAIIFTSFASMITGMWYKKKRKLMPVAAVGAVFMFSGMYPFYSLWLQIIGIAIMAFTYLPMYSFRASRLLKI